MERSPDVLANSSRAAVVLGYGLHSQNTKLLQQLQQQMQQVRIKCETSYGSHCAFYLEQQLQVMAQQPNFMQAIQQLYRWIMSESGDLAEFRAKDMMKTQLFYYA